MGRFIKENTDTSDTAEIFGIQKFTRKDTYYCNFLRLEIIV